ncbi:MAG TPA: hypothetical protein V6D00_03190 [Pantanalinema sp.]
MSYATQKAECDPNCALWRALDGKSGQCGLLSVNDRIAEGFEVLADSLREIKGRL